MRSEMIAVSSPLPSPPPTPPAKIIKQSPPSSPVPVADASISMNILKVKKEEENVDEENSDTEEEPFDEEELLSTLTVSPSNVDNTIRTIAKPFVYGSIASKITDFTDIPEEHTHRWTVYVRPYHNEDISLYVSRVEFRLHDSFYQPVRVLTAPPYEVTETGWGEFDVVIRLSFRDKSLRPISLVHPLKLFRIGEVIQLPGASESVMVVNVPQESKLDRAIDLKPSNTRNAATFGKIYFSYS